MLRKLVSRLGLCAVLVGSAMPLAHAAELTITSPAGAAVTFTTEQLLKHPALRDIRVPDDIGYHADMRYRAVPLAALLKDFGAPDAQTGLEIRATDGFVAHLPYPLAMRDDDGNAGEYARAWLAIEPPDAPWPKLPKSAASAGPFSVVWTDPAASGIRSEQWPYQVRSIGFAAFPLARWPQLALPADAPQAAKDGLEVFAMQCFSCHRMNGAGTTELGPDLNLPMNPTRYFRADVLPRLIRRPADVRHWPGMKMHGFTAEELGDAEIANVIAYLDAMARRTDAERAAAR